MRTIFPAKARQQVSTKSQRDRQKKRNEDKEEAEEDTGVGNDDEAQD